MDRMFVNGETYRYENTDTGVITTVKVEHDRIVLVRAENEAGETLDLSPEQIAEAESSMAARIKSGAMRPLHEDEL